MREVHKVDDARVDAVDAFAPRGVDSSRAIARRDHVVEGHVKRGDGGRGVEREFNDGPVAGREAEAENVTMGVAREDARPEDKAVVGVTIGMSRDQLRGR